MIISDLPNAAAIKKVAPKAFRTEVIFAKTDKAFFYPEHETPYLLAANFINKGSYVLNRKRIDITNNQFYFLNPGDRLEIAFDKAIPRQTLLILFEEKFIKQCFGYLMASENALLNDPTLGDAENIEFPDLPFAISGMMHENISQLLNLGANSGDTNSVLFEIISECMMLNISTQKEMNKIKAIKQSTKKELYKRLFAAKAFMTENVACRLTIDQISKEVFLDKFHFLSAFKDLYGKTPHQYLTELKLQKAMELLQSKKHGVSDVCFLVGFESISSFSTLFKKRFGASPSTFSL